MLFENLLFFKNVPLQTQQYYCVLWNAIILQGNGMSFKYYDIPIFALNKEKEVDDLIKVLLI